MGNFCDIFFSRIDSIAQKDQVGCTAHPSIPSPSHFSIKSQLDKDKEDSTLKLHRLHTEKFQKYIHDGSCLGAGRS